MDTPDPCSPPCLIAKPYGANKVHNLKHAPPEQMINVALYKVIDDLAESIRELAPALPVPIAYTLKNLLLWESFPKEAMPANTLSVLREVALVMRETPLDGAKVDALIQVRDSLRVEEEGHISTRALVATFRAKWVLKAVTEWKIRDSYLKARFLRELGLSSAEVRAVLAVGGIKTEERERDSAQQLHTIGRDVACLTPRKKPRVGP